MLYAEDFRRIARRQLGYRWTGNKWGTFALITFIYTLIEAGISFLSTFYIGTVVGLVVSGPFSLGFAIVALNTVRGGSPQMTHFFDQRKMNSELSKFNTNAVPKFLKQAGIC